ncbi:MAG TPA: hypothetical protein VFA49_00675 [Chloroflexota bacterium]|nr:hypothetical protein [Chloroflexota bacterium]
MARISISRVGDIYRITLKGRLSALDLQRLERACGSALQQKVVPLELDVNKVNSIDDAAQAYLDRLRARGARIHGYEPLARAEQ